MHFKFSELTEFGMHCKFAIELEGRITSSTAKNVVSQCDPTSLDTRYWNPKLLLFTGEMVESESLNSTFKSLLNTGSCYSVSLRDKHCCIENSMKNNCPICYEVCVLMFFCQNRTVTLPSAYCSFKKNAVSYVRNCRSSSQMQYLFDSLRETSVLRCGHTMHLQCFHEMLKHDK